MNDQILYLGDIDKIKEKFKDVDEKEIYSIYDFEDNDYQIAEELNSLKFPNLIYLYVDQDDCTCSSFRSKDFEFLNKLTKLKYLFLGLFQKIENLTTIDFSKCSNLEELHLLRLVDINYLDLSKNIKLKKFSIECSNIVEIKFGKGIEDIHFVDNTDFVEKFDFSECINLKYLTISISEAKSFDLSNCVNLKELSIDAWRVKKSLDLSKCINLEDIDIDAKDILIKYPKTPYPKLHNLKDLYLEGCHNPLNFPSKLTQLKKLSIHDTYTEYLSKPKLIPITIPYSFLKDLCIMHTNFTVINLLQCMYLEKLFIHDCNHLKCIKIPEYNISLRSVELSSNKYIKNFKNENIHGDDDNEERLNIIRMLRNPDMP